ncbi:MAG: hypothetical protein M3040_17475 [Bacteroidota bacterium]|nr:hypothetical protein [Bacteroidota bacterium]
MNLNVFIESLHNAAPPNTSVYLKALWYDKKDNWKAAHDLVNDLENKQGAWLHAYLHRKEGDIWNADYWYNRAGRKRPNVSLQQEWEQLVNAFIIEAGA